MSLGIDSYRQATDDGNTTVSQPVGEIIRLFFSCLSSLPGTNDGNPQPIRQLSADVESKRRVGQMFQAWRVLLTVKESYYSRPMGCCPPFFIIRVDLSPLVRNVARQHLSKARYSDQIAAIGMPGLFEAAEELNQCRKPFWAYAIKHVEGYDIVSFTPPQGYLLPRTLCSIIVLAE